MAYTLKLSTDPSSDQLAIGSQVTLVLDVTWEQADPPLTLASKVTFKYDTNSVGTVTYRKAGVDTNLPIEKSTPNEFKSSSRTATYQQLVKADKNGLAIIVASIDTTPVATSNSININIVDPNTLFSSPSGFTNPAMKVYTDDGLTFTTATAENKSTITFKSLDKNNAPLANTPININVEYMRAIRNGGKYFDTTGQEVSFVSIDETNGLGQAQLNTNANGDEILTVVSNTNSAFIRAYLSSGTEVQPKYNLYLYDDTVNLNLPNLDPFINKNDNGAFDLPKNSTNTFDVTVLPTANDGEFTALIMNGKLQQEVRKEEGQNTRITFKAKTADLIFGNTSPRQNEIFYTVSNKGTLSNSKRLFFNVNGTAPNDSPLPLNPYVGPILGIATGFIINKFTIGDDFPLSVPLAADILKIKGQGASDLVAGNSIRVFVNLRGDDQNNVYRQNNLTFDFDIPDLTASTVQTPIDSNLFLGYGTTADSANPHDWTVWYSYMDSKMGTTRLAESFISTGPLYTVDS